MILDLRNDAAFLRRELEKKVRDYAARAAKSKKVPPVSAVEVGYEFAQAGWVCVHFDTRPEHDRDGEWTNFIEREMVGRPNWFKIAEACYCGDEEEEEDPPGKRKPAPKKPIVLVLHTGKEKDARKLDEDAYSAALGAMIKDVLLQARKDGIFEKLPKHPKCQFDIEEFNGSWAWPEYKQLGKANLI